MQENIETKTIGNRKFILEMLFQSVKDESIVNIFYN